MTDYKIDQPKLLANSKDPDEKVQIRICGIVFSL